MMLGTLRRRLILSHTLPLLVIIPLVGITLIYVLETNVILPELADQLASEAALIARLTGDEPSFWDDPARAAAFLSDMDPHVDARFMLFDSEGHLLASNDPGDDGRLGQRPDRPDLGAALAGAIRTTTTYSRNLGAEVADVWFPVRGPDQQVVGVIRLSHRLASVEEQLMRLRYLITAVLLEALALGVALGLLLALNVERPLRRATWAIWNLASGQHLTPLVEQGPQDTRLLLRAVNSLVERLRNLETARRRLLANLVHELGRPLAAMQAGIRALRGGATADPELSRELLDGMDEEVTRLGRLLDDLAQLHDQVLGSLELERKPISLTEWLPQVLVTWREAAYSKGLQWQARVPADLPILEADSDGLARVLGNVLSNAVKYTPSGGTICIEAGAQDREAWIRVGDTGPGIDPEDQARIFSPFYQGHSITRFPQGMGLGLSIANDLVVAHGGRIEVDSTPGQGSRFTMWIPLAKPDTPPY
jgi:two-component system sensor histidine kinase BaeS